MLEYLEDIVGSSRFKEPIGILKTRVEELDEHRTEKLTRVKLVEKEKDELHDEVERLYSRKDANARLVNISSSTARDCSETFLKKHGCGGGVVNGAVAY